MERKYKTIGTARTNYGKVYGFFADREGHLYVCSPELDSLTEDYLRRHTVTQVISNTIFTRSGRAYRFLFETDQEKEVQAFLDKCYPKRDESLIEFVKNIEDVTYISDIEKFRDCVHIIERTALDKFSEEYSISSSDDTSYYLVEAAFEKPAGSFFGHKLFLQKIWRDHSYGMTAWHQELTPELYIFSQRPEVKGKADKALELMVNETR